MNGEQDPCRQAKAEIHLRGRSYDLPFSIYLVQLAESGR